MDIVGWVLVVVLNTKGEATTVEFNNSTACVKVLQETKRLRLGIHRMCVSKETGVMLTK